MRVFQNLKRETICKLTTDIVSYLKENKRGGNIFTEFGIGGYYIYKLTPDFKVFWDGRLNILYPYQFAKKYLDAGLIPAKVFSNEVNNYPIDYVALKISMADYFTITEHKDYQLEFIGEDFFLFSKDSSTQVNNFNSTSKLSLFPMCWKPEVDQEILNEKVNTRNTNLDKNSRISNLFTLIENYSKQINKPAFYNSKSTLSIKTDPERRSLAYMALKSGYYSHAIFFFSSLKNQNNRDILMLISAYEKDNQFNKAEGLIAVMLNIEKSAILKLKPLNSFEQAVMLTLIHRIEAKNKYLFKNETQLDIKQLKKTFDPKTFSSSLPLKSIFSDKGCNNIFSN